MKRSMDRVMLAALMTGGLAARRAGRRAEGHQDPEDEGRGDHAQERVRPVEAGQERFVLEFTSPDGKPLDAGKVTLSTSMAMPGMAPDDRRRHAHAGQDPWPLSSAPSASPTAALAR